MGGRGVFFVNVFFDFLFFIFYSRSEFFYFPQTPNPTPCGVGRGLGEFGVAV
jgi:hypothetical protein